VNGYFHDGMIFGVISWKFILAMVLLVLGVLIIGCGVNVCWVRFARRKAQGPPRTPDRQ
jgi:hypothetical protein